MDGIKPPETNPISTESTDSTNSTKEQPKKNPRPTLRGKLVKWQRKNRLSTLITNKNTVKLDLPHKYGFNGAIAEFQDKYVCVYRSGLHPYHTHVPQFSACFLDKDFKVIPETSFTFSLTRCLDPRLIWYHGRLLMFYSSASEGIEGEHMMVTTIIDPQKSTGFIDAPTYRVSPISLPGRQKNWVPFYYNDELLLIASASPHIIYSFEMRDDKVHTKFAYRSLWKVPISHEDLRCNTGPIPLDNGSYLSTFHIVTTYALGGQVIKLYDNYCYTFDGKPPFRILRCGFTSYSRAEDAIQSCPVTINAKDHLVIFPTSMIRQKEKLVISYGDNDCGVKILKTSLDDMLATTSSLTIQKML